MVTNVLQMSHIRTQKLSKKVSKWLQIKILGGPIGGLVRGIFIGLWSLLL